MLVNFLLLVLILLRLIIGIRLLIVARQNNLPNLYWLAVYFLAIAGGLPFAPSVGNPLGNLPFSIWLFIGVGVLFTQPLLIAFNQTTFHQGRKSPSVWLWAAYILFGIPTLYGIFISASNYNQSPWVAAYTPTLLLIWGWHAWAAYQAQAGMKQESAVEDWVKSRYHLIVTYSIIIMIGGLASFIRIFFAGGSNVTPLGNVMGIISLGTQIASVILQFLVWVMPQGFRTWLNRNQRLHTEERNREQVIAVLNILSSAMSAETGLPKLVAIYTIRKTIGRKIGSEDSIKIEEHAISLGYNDWLDLINSPELYNQIENSPAAVSANKIVTRAKHALVEKQSLFTMQAK